MTPAFETFARVLIPFAVTLAISTDAAAQERGDAAPFSQEERALPLDGSSRFSLQTGWRYTPNSDFYDAYYSQKENRGLPRARGALGGPLLTATFAYSALEWLELGVDLFFTYERMRLTRQPGLNALTFGALVGLRLQKRLEIGREGLILFAGPVIGPTFAAGYLDGGEALENFAQAFGASVGMNLRLTPEWGFCVEYRLTHMRAEIEDVGAYQAGGHWVAVGLTYVFSSDSIQSRNRRF
ncbi:hypothetical protein [Stigmatella aurantiaca]|nr:hypothetical protein [Stigmatella aurantiaca]ADO75974.1 uncharacterized protein STAUR_8219 [Stigmatella aurantiaca DW4/3-1]